MSLVRFSHTAKPIKDLNNKIRHIYDVHKMLEEDGIKTFFNSDGFEIMLIRVGNVDVIGFKSNNEWLRIHPKKAVLFSEPNKTWSELKNGYLIDFEKLVYGILPNEKDLLKTIIKVSKRLKYTLVNKFSKINASIRISRDLKLQI